MRRAAIILMVLTILSLGLLPTSAPSQEEHGSGPQSSGLPYTVGTLAEMMRDIHQVLHLGPLTSDEAQQVSIIMRRIGVMMQEMGNPQAERFQSLHQWELQEMKKHLEETKARLESRRK